jgi:type IV pilus assembly protein PilC
LVIGMRFKYQARTPEGETRAGVVEAVNQDSAVEILQKNGLIVISVHEENIPFWQMRIKFFDRVKMKDVVIFSRQLSTLFEAKVPVVESLKTLVSESFNITLKNAVSEVLDDISGGSNLSQAMTRHPQVFSSFYINMVKAGEESGKLHEVFNYLADYLERSYAIASKAKNAMIYPVFVFFAFIGVMIVMLVVVVPRLTSIFEESGQQVPLYTRIVMGISAFLQQWGFLLFLLLIAGGIVLWRFAQTERGKEFLDELKIRTPLFGGLFQKLYLARISDNLGTLIAAGVPILRALQISSDVVGNRVYQRIMLDAAESVKAGSTISYSLQKYKEIPPLISQMIKIGEESGRLEFILQALARFYQRDVDNALENLVGLIEPALIIFLGVGVGGLVAAILVPLYNISSVL